jgi:outer membrane protein assembly factor BamB
LANTSIIAVIPTFVILGPLAVLAALMPFVFGGLALALRRWRILLLVASLDCGLFFACSWFQPMIATSWVRRPAVLWSMLALIAIAGTVWSWYRYRIAFAAKSELVALPPTPIERSLLTLTSVIGVGVTSFCLLKGILLDSPWREIAIVWVVAWAGTLSSMCSRMTNRWKAAAETVMLGALAAVCAGLALVAVPPRDGDNVKVVWIFEPVERGAIWSSPLVSNERVYVSAIHGVGFSTSGALYCIDRETGKEIWKFNDSGRMKQAFSSPCTDGCQVFVGEGLHVDTRCKLYCVEASSGKKRWDFQTASHVESSPCVHNGKVYFGAGDDGIYCLDTTTGREIWHFNEGHHIDASPIIAGGRVYVGSGSGAVKPPEFLCFDAESGKVLWRQQIEVAASGSPRVFGPNVCFGMGNGTYNHSVEPPEVPGGACLCLNAETGTTAMRHSVGDAVLTAPECYRDYLYFGSRDHNIYCVDTDDTLRWKQDLGSPVVAAPALLGDGLYAIAAGGSVRCLDAMTGSIRWTFDVASYSRTKPQLFSSPRVLAEIRGGREVRRVYFGAALDNSVSEAGVLFCIEER